MQIVTASQTRQNFAAVLGRVAYGKERVTIERRGKPLAVLVPIEDLEALESGGKRVPDESEARLKALLEGSPVEFGVKDRDGRYLMVSREFERLNGKTGDEIIGRSPEDIYPPETAEAIRRHDQEVLKTGKTVEWEIDAPLQDGMHTYLVAKFPVRGADNRITGIGAVATDITEQKKTQAALRKSEELLRSIADNIPGTVYQRIQHRDGRTSYSYISPGVTDMLGLDPDAVTNDAATLTDNIHPDDRAERQRAIEESARTLAPYEAEYRHLTPSGETKWVRAIAQPRRQDNGDIIWDGITLDVTEAKRAEAALRESEARFRSLYESIPLSVWEEDWSDVKKMIDRLSSEGISDWQAYFESHADEVKRAYDLCNTVSLNSTTLQMYHVPTKEEALRLTSSEHLTAEEVQTVANWLATFATGNSMFVTESEETRDDGTSFAARFRSYVPPERAHDWARVITTVEDITQRKRAEEALRESEAALAKAQHLARIGNWRWSVERNELISCSDVYAEIHGVSCDEIFDLMKDQMDRVVHPNDRERVAETFKKVDEEGLDYQIEYRIVRPDGDIRHVLEIGEVNFDASGRGTEQVGTVQDITERKRTEEALRESETLTRQAAEMANLGHWVWDEIEDRCVYCSETLARMNEVTVEEYLARFGTMQALTASLHPDDRARYEQVISAAKNERRTYDIEFKDLTPNGEFRYLRERGEPIFDDNGKLVRTVGTLQDVSDYKRAEETLRRSHDELELRVQERTRDIEEVNETLKQEITERKRAEQALLASEARAKDAEQQLLDAIESISEGFILFDSDERFILCNQKYREFYPQIADMLVPGAKLEDLVRTALERHALQETSGTVEEWTRLRLEKYRKARGTHEVHLQDGRWLLCSERKTQVGGIVGIRTDITENKRAEEALRESESRAKAAEEQLLDAIESISEGFILFDSDERFILCNQKYREFFPQIADMLVPGAKLEDLVRTDVERHALQETSGTVEEWTRLWLEKYRKARGTHDVHLQDGRWLLCSERRTRAGGAVGIRTDITERQQAAESLRESAERLRQATQLAGLGHWVWDAIEDRCIYCSEEHARIHGITPEEYMARAATLDGDSSLIHPDDRKRMKATFRSLRNGHGFETEYRVVTPNGDARWVREIAKPVFDDTGTVVREYGTVQDISERRQAEETIRTREAWLSAILDGSPIEIVLKDTDGKIFLANKKSLEGLGVTPDQALGKRTSDFLPHDIAKIYEDADRLVLESGEPTQKEVTEHRSGRTYHYLSSKFPLKDETNAILGICSITTDISRITEVQNQLRQAQKMEAVGQLTGGVAHDFNNLMAVVMGNVELLSDRIGADDPQIQAIMRASTRGAELTQRLLAFSRQQPLHPRPVDLEALVEGMTHLLSRTLGETIEIDVSSSPNLWAALADSGQVENALLNLALNARDAMPGGGTLTIETANAKLNRHDIAGREDTRPGDYVVLVVRDTGHGIPPEVLEHVFEPFFTTKDVGEGTGLGLSMVYGFAQQSGGHITIDSAEGQGTIVKLYLPRVTEAEKEASEETATSETIPRARGEAVLVIEDDPAVRELTVTILESLGYHVMAARNEKAVSKILATNERIDLVLCDVVLPGGRSGPDFAAEAMFSRPNVKLLFMSGYASEELPPSLHDGVVLLNKPFRKAELAIKLREVLDGD